MNAVPFDTLKLARDLETAGLAAPVAAGTAAALAEALMGADFATKSDLAAVETRLTTEIRGVRAEVAALENRMDARFAAQDAKFAAHDARFDALDGRFGAIDGKFDAQEKRFDAKLEILRRDLTIKMGSMFIIAVGVILTAMRFMPHPYP